MNVTRLSPSIGAEIGGIDLSKPVASDVFDELRTLFDEHGLLCFRGQTLSADRQVAVAANFGPIAPNGDGSLHKRVANVATDRAMDFVSESRLLMHSDLQFAPMPLLGLSLYGEVTGEGVPATLFANAGRAYDGLSPDIRAKIDGLMALQVADLRADASLTYRPRLIDVVGRPCSEFPRTVHPVVYVHPRTGRRILFVGEHQTAHVIGLTENESEALLAELFAELYAPDNLYAHDWRQGDLLIWDNILLQHGRPETPANVTRVLRRVVMATHSQTYLETAAMTG
jgi:taurine dioxygenase